MLKVKQDKSEPAAPIETSNSTGITAKRESTTASSDQPVNKKTKTNEVVLDDEVIMILSDTEDGNNSDGTVNLLGDGDDDDDDDDDDDEVFIVEPSESAKSTTTISTAMDESADDEVQAIGEKNVMKLPHARHHCTQYKFVLDVSTTGVTKGLPAHLFQFVEKLDSTNC